MGIWYEIISAGLAVALVLSGLRLAFKQQVTVDQAGHIVDIKLSTTGGHFRARSLALVIIILGALFFATPFLWKRYVSPPTMHVLGKILLHEGQTVSGLQGAIVGILPTHSHTTAALQDGTYSIDIPKGADEETYQAVVHVNTNPALSVLGVVRFDSSGRGSFDHTFQRSKR